MNDVPLHGNLGDIGLPRILITLNRRGLTGRLELRAPHFTKKVYIVKGDAVFASSSYEDDRLGEMLLKAGKITVEQYDKSVEKLKETKKRQGAILVDLGYLKPKELFWGVKFQVREIIYSLFPLEEGEYEFIEGDVPQDEVITLKMSMGNLIYEGIKRVDNWTRIRREMPSMNDVIMLSEDPLSLFQDIELGTQDKKILSLIDGKKSIQEIIDLSWIGSFEALKTLYVLFSTGMLVKSAGVSGKGETVKVDELLSELTEEEVALSKRIDDFLKKIQSSDPFDILELSPDADEAAIKKNYYRLAKEFHPDRHYNSEEASVKDKLSVIFDALTNAYNIIREPEQRAAHKEAALTPRHTPSQEEPSRMEDPQMAKQQFQAGIEEFKKGDFWGAMEKFQWATRLDGKNANYWNYLSLALSKNPKKLKQAEEALLEAVKLEPDNADFLANLGLIYAKAGLHKRATTQFEKALTLDPNNEKAKKGLDEVKSKK